jgi:hypothetical protein
VNALTHAYIPFVKWRFAALRRLGYFSAMLTELFTIFQFTGQGLNGIFNATSRSVLLNIHDHRFILL